MYDFNCKTGRAEFGKRLKKARKKAGYNSQEEFAQVLNVRRATVTAWERGENFPTLPNLSDICRYLSVDLGYLCGEYEEQSEIVSVVCNQTGLSENAYNRVLELQKNNSAQLIKWAQGTTELEHLLLSDEFPEILRLFNLFRVRCSEALTYDCQANYAKSDDERRRGKDNFIKAKGDEQLFLFNIQQLLFRRAENIEEEIKREKKQIQKRLFEYIEKEGASDADK